MTRLIAFVGRKQCSWVDVAQDDAINARLAIQAALESRVYRLAHVIDDLKAWLDDSQERSREEYDQKDGEFAATLRYSSFLPSYRDHYPHALLEQGQCWMRWRLVQALLVDNRFGQCLCTCEI